MRQVHLVALPGALAATFPQEMGVDLVFPRDQETYKPTTPFPLVLAFHGAPSIWPPNLTVRLTLGEPGSEPIETVVVNATQAVEEGLLEEEDDGMYFAVLGLFWVGDVSGEMRLAWVVEYEMDCEGAEQEWSGSASVRFDFDAEGGDEMDVVGDGDYCPKYVHAMLVKERLSETCLEIEPPDISGECEIEVPRGLGRGVEAKLDEIGERASRGGGGCNDSPFIEGDWGDEGDEPGEDEGDENSGALSLGAGMTGVASSLAMLIPTVASLL